jgi:hypothetical protein
VTRIVIELPESVAEALHHEARRLLLGRRAYVRYLLAAVAGEVNSLRTSDANQPGATPVPAPQPADCT